MIIGLEDMVSVGSRPLGGEGAYQCSCPARPGVRIVNGLAKALDVEVEAVADAEGCGVIRPFDD
jgi:hypothetical protein